VMTPVGTAKTREQRLFAFERQRREAMFRR
jgi:hypothetical protein